MNDKLEYLRTFITAVNPEPGKLFSENSGRGDIQPSVEPETGRFLSFLVHLISARRVLELGTSNGCSALWFMDALKENGGSLVTIDSKERLHHEALLNLQNAGFSEQVTAIFGDAEEETAKLEPGFDLIFQDCGKYLYPKMHEQLVGLLKAGGLLVADDTLFSVESGVRPNLGRFTDEYNRMVFSDPRLFSCILPVGHGLTLSFKR
ncbi:MAG: O-methyltransferase [Spirochaetales bacterium]|nr:O-methyltransferase [Spirochaetales bacterium]